jgi:hypothetical protein
MARNNRIQLTVLLLSASVSLSYASTANTTISVRPAASGEGFDIQGSFVVPLTDCQSYLYLTDYDVERELPGVITIKHTRIAPKKVRLERELEERVLIFPIQISSVIEITERPNRGMDFIQLSGNARSYKGQWRLEPTVNGTRFIYKAHTVPGTLLPDTMTRQFIEDSLRRNFDAMVDIASRRHATLPSVCTDQT